MKHILVLLSSAVLLCSVAPVSGLVSCSPYHITAATRLAEHRINQHHHHGYKLRLSETKSINIVKVAGGFKLQLHMTLLETKCHVVNPIGYKDCALRANNEMAVMANCNVEMIVKGVRAKVIKYACDTRQAKTNEEMKRLCPDCPVLVALDRPEAQKCVQETLRVVNNNPEHKHYYTLKETGRVTTAYVMNVGITYYTEVVLVETRCRMGSGVALAACEPRCPDLASHAVCHTSYSPTHGVGAVKCQFYHTSKILHPWATEPKCELRKPHTCPYSEGDGYTALHPVCPWPRKLH